MSVALGLIQRRRSVITELLVTGVACLATGYACAGTLSFATYTTANGLGSNSVAAVFASGNTIYAATGGGLSISTNGGATFTNYTTANGLGSNNTNSVYVSGSTIYTATSGTGFSVSSNGGNNWTRFTTASGLAGNNVNDVFSADGVIYVAGSGVSISTNNGSSWVSTISGKTVYSGYASGSNVYAGSKAEGLWMSNDSGTNWTNYTTANGLGGTEAFDVYAYGSTIYAATNGGLSVSADGGVNWTNFTNANGLGSNGVRGVFTDSNYIYAATSGGLSIAPVPEPSTYAMALAGLACGGWQIFRRRRLRHAPSLAGLAALACLPFGSIASAEPIQWVTVGDPGNTADTTGQPNPAGAVATSFQIMKYEFTNQQYTDFLNSVDASGTNPNSVYNASMGSDARGGISFTSRNTPGTIYAVRSNMGDKPVNFVSWFDAARVANWLHNGAQTYGNTDASANAPQNNGAYMVGTATSGAAVAKNSGALFYVPTENEWYKAAYYNPTLNSDTGGYHVYGNGFDEMPGIISADTFGNGSAGSAGNFANYSSGADWNNLNGNVTTVGTNGGPSAYEAFDMSGNVLEWNDGTGDAGPFRVRRGGVFSDLQAIGLSSSIRITNPPSYEDLNTGFRLASASPVPEPATLGMASGGALCAGGWWVLKRRRKRA